MYTSKKHIPEPAECYHSGIALKIPSVIFSEGSAKKMAIVVGMNKEELHYEEAIGNKIKHVRISCFAFTSAMGEKQFSFPLCSDLQGHAKVIRYLFTSGMPVRLLACMPALKHLHQHVLPHVVHDYHILSCCTYLKSARLGRFWAQNLSAIDILSTSSLYSSSSSARIP